MKALIPSALAPLLCLPVWLWLQPSGQLSRLSMTLRGLIHCVPNAWLQGWLDP